MEVLPKAVTWLRPGGAGMETVVYDDGNGLTARGRAMASRPEPYMVTYGLRTDPRWRSIELKVVAEGAGWWRNVRLTAGAGGWDVHTATKGRVDFPLPGLEDPFALADVVDIDLQYSPLTPTLPVRRTDLLAAAPGTAHTLSVAHVLVPTLSVLCARQTYTVVAGGRIRYASDTTSADMAVDAGGFLVSCPGLAERTG